MGLTRKYVMAKHLAAALDINERTLLNWHRRGRGPLRSHRGRNVRYYVRDIMAWGRDIADRAMQAEREERERSDQREE
ncbi:MAG: hypothetical protein RBT43_07290 [bacterium]|jgi:phage terminase Nu1 subunit (DNA packaging protein)|nr:hypothetical protein [bacterium]